MNTHAIMMRLRHSSPPEENARRNLIRTGTPIALLLLAGACSAPPSGGSSASTDPSAPMTAGGSIHTDILNGAPAPWWLDVVRIIRWNLNGTYNLCTGTMILPNVALTAGHCLTAEIPTTTPQQVWWDTSRYTVQVEYSEGSFTNFNIDALQVEGFFVNDPTRIDSDMAILHLPSAPSGMPDGRIKVLTQARWNNPGYQIPNWVGVLVVGYGETETGAISNTKLQGWMASWESRDADLTRWLWLCLEAAVHTRSYLFDWANPMYSPRGPLRAAGALRSVGSGICYRGFGSRATALFQGPDSNWYLAGVTHGIDNATCTSEHAAVYAASFSAYNSWWLPAALGNWGLTLP